MTGHTTIITDKASFAVLWAGPMTCAQIGELYGVSGPGVSDAAKRFGLPSRSHRRGQSQKRVPAPAPEKAGKGRG